MSAFDSSLLKRHLLNPYFAALCIGYFAFAVADIPYLLVPGTTEQTFFSGKFLFFVISVGAVLIVFGIICSVALRYRLPFGKSLLPRVSVLVPVLNEEMYIFETLTKVARSDYPSSHLEVVLINDGSTDGTMKEVRRFEKEYGPINVLDYSENRGKREALISGVGDSTGEVLVFLDSDTLVRPDAIRVLASSLDDKTLAVCGEVLVGNRDRNLITRLQEFDYFISFNFFKAFESRFGLVTCCPGCFSAIRRDALLEVLPQWTDQLVLGTPCSYGEDRFLTSLLLERGEVRYQAQAMAETIVPYKLGGLFRQRLRWSRSWFINSLLVSRHIWRRSPVASSIFYLIFVSTLFVPMWVADLVFQSPDIAGDPTILAVPMLVLVGLVLLQVTVAAKKRRWLTVVRAPWYVAGYFLMLVWLVPLSIATISNNRWGSRGLQQD